MLKSCLVVLFALASFCVSAAQISFDFSNDEPGRLPPYFQSFVTSEGEPADWKVAEVQVPPVLAPLSPNAAESYATRPVLSVQSADPSTDYCPLLLFTNEIFTDFSFVTRFKIVGGVVEPVAGIVFRAQDQSNYYVLRASTAGNLLWYRVVGGKQYDMLGIGVKTPVPVDQWQELRVDCHGTQIRCFLNGRLAIPPAKAGAPTNDLAINDTTFATGKIGFWTRADSKCYFVDAHVDYTPKVPFVQSVVEQVVRQFPAVESLKIYANKSAGLPVIIADPNQEELNSPGTKYEADVIEHGQIYYLKVKKAVEVTLPLRDRNGDIVAALKLRMKSFPGETQQTAVAKATEIKTVTEFQIDKMQGISE